MSTTRTAPVRSTGKARRNAAALLSLGAMSLGSVALLGSPAGAAPKASRVSGTLDFRLAPTPACPDPGCVVIDFRGGIRGSGAGPTTAAFPAQPATNVVGEGTAVVHTRRGDLNLAGTSVFNSDPASDGEITIMFRIVGGTSGLAGASGYLMAAGTSEVPGAVASNVRYTGMLVLP